MSGSAWLSLGVLEYLPTIKSTHFYTALLFRPIHPFLISSSSNGVACYQPGGSEAYLSICGKQWIGSLFHSGHTPQGGHPLTTQNFSDLLAKTQVSRANLWFSLSAYAFHGQLYDGQDGYTILWVPGGLKVTPEGQRGAESGEVGNPQILKHEYALWEFSNVHPIMVEWFQNVYGGWKHYRFYCVLWNFIPTQWHMSHKLRYASPTVAQRLFRGNFFHPQRKLATS